ncbi:nitronate monooxygenase [Actinotalea sp. K2]|uniref:nitronate monooxygenase n=1 Tax=Actinotalea sp. K2 TaxID=2939438 RepID=UPI0020178F75|nr:nitronate monooxygenase [Actinotalea sp. K2]MCL3862869.1 nitronate monooxygenase [Actinotalea sp. K2]
MSAPALERSVPRQPPRSQPVVIQGGMGVAVSSWRLASSVARAGQLGVVSGTALDLVLARRLQDGDVDGSVRRALAAFPVPVVAERAVARYHRPEGRAPGRPYTPIPRLALRQTRLAQELTILGNFVEVWLAKEGHEGLVGINYLEKVQMATPAAAYGAMLAGVDHVLMGAGIPRDIPHLLDGLAGHETVRLPIEVAGAAAGDHVVELDPRALLGEDLPALTRPTFLAIVSAHVLAEYLARDPHIRPDGFVVEGHLAGGHNAPPRGRLTLDDLGQPVFGPRDQADLAKVAAIGLPFWLAGSVGTPGAVDAARAAGAAGVQVGTLFALSTDSGLEPGLRTDMLDRLRAGTLEVRTDPLASPTGFPFKVAQLPGTLSETSVSAARPRLCDLGYLRTPYLRPSGEVGYRCAAEPVHTHVRKGGSVEDTVGRACLCNALSANVGLGQTRADGYAEEALVTLGADLDGARHLLGTHPEGWTALDALDWLLGGVSVTRPGTATAIS